MSADSNISPSLRKSKNPAEHPQFPLRVHKGTNYWCKKIRGHVYYFGRVADDPKGIGALELYLKERDDLEAGREPRDIEPDALTIVQLTEKYKEHQQARFASNEISARTFQGHERTCTLIKDGFGENRTVAGLSPGDFAKLRVQLAKRLKLVALRNEIQRIRSVFRYAVDMELIPRKVNFGPGFAKPTTDSIELAKGRHREKHGERMFEASEIRTMLDGKNVANDEGESVFVPGASQPLRAMLLMAANCGFGQTDLSSIPLKAVNLDKGWVDFPRPKNGRKRRCWLWPETVAAIREWLPLRPKAKHADDARLLFLTPQGRRWVTLNRKGTPNDILGKEFAKLIRALELKRSRVSFYAIRHTFETVAGETADQVAVNRVMGHRTPGMSDVYTERISDARLRAVSQHVREWLFAESEADDPNRESSEPEQVPESNSQVENPAPDTSDNRPRLQIVG